MTLDVFLSTIGLPLAATVAGLAFGLAYFAALRRSVAAFAAGDGWLGPAAFTLARICGAAILLALLARLGAASLLAAFLGFLVAQIGRAHV